MIGTVRISQLPSAFPLTGAEGVIVNQNSTTRLSTVESVIGLSTANGAYLGISSSGTSITSGPVTELNFIGVGNTFEVNGTSVDISIRQEVEDVFIVACSDEDTDLTSGTAKVSFVVPYPYTLIDVKAGVNSAPTGSNLIVDINKNGSTILSTKLSIDNGETTSSTATTSVVISDSSLPDGSIVSIDIDQVGSTNPGKGLKVTLYATRSV